MFLSRTGCCGDLRCRWFNRRCLNNSCRCWLRCGLLCCRCFLCCSRDNYNLCRKMYQIVLKTRDMLDDSLLWHLLSSLFTDKMWQICCIINYYTRGTVKTLLFLPYLWSVNYDAILWVLKAFVYRRRMFLGYFCTSNAAVSRHDRTRVIFNVDNWTLYTHKHGCGNTEHKQYLQITLFSPYPYTLSSINYACAINV